MWSPFSERFSALTAISYKRQKKMRLKSKLFHLWNFETSSACRTESEKLALKWNPTKVKVGDGENERAVWWMACCQWKKGGRCPFCFLLRIWSKTKVCVYSSILRHCEGWMPGCYHFSISSPPQGNLIVAVERSVHFLKMNCTQCTLVQFKLESPQYQLCC